MSDTQLRNSYAQLMFYVRERYWHHGEQLCANVAATMDDWTFRVWRALCLDQQGLYNEALKEYRSAESKRQTAIPAIMGMLLIYKRTKDNENVTRLEIKLQDAETALSVAADDGQALIDALSQAAAMAWAAGEVYLARDILTRVPESQIDSHVNEYTNAGVIKGWVELTSGRAALLEKCGAYFQKSLDVMASATAGGGSSGNRYVDMNAALGRVAYLERKYQFGPAQDLLSKLTVAHPNFLPALIVKARLLMQAEDWEQAVDATRRVLAKDAHNMEALSLQALHALVKDARPAAAQTYLSALWDAAQTQEPRNAPLMLQLAQVFSRLASGTGAASSGFISGGGADMGSGGGSAGSVLQLLTITGKFASLASSLDNRNGDYTCELGHQAFLKGDHKTALTLFEKAAASADTIAPMLGSAACLIQLGKLEEAAKQCLLCNQLHSDSSSSSASSSGNNSNSNSSGRVMTAAAAAVAAELQLLNAKIAWRLRGDEKRALQLLDQAAEAVRQQITGAVTVNTSSGLDLYTRVNVPLMLAIARDYSQHTRNEPPDPTFRRADPIGERIRKHLELLLRHVPGCMEGQIMLARVHFISGEVAAAQAILRECLFHREQPLPEGFLLSAQICQYTGNTKLAGQALEQALTLDFEVKDQPLFNVLNGVLLASAGQNQPALEALQLALSIVKNPQRVTAKGRAIAPLTVPDHITLYLQLAQVELRLRDADEARRLLSECAGLFRETQQAGRVAIAQSMLTARTDIDKSIDLLRQVPAASDFYVSARTQMAKMYLVHKLDPVSYIACLEEMVKERVTPESFVQLGEAYTTVQEPEKAIAVYEKAQAMDPKNSELAIRVGRVLVSTHDYKKSVKYYEDALAADEGLFSVRADLAMLYWHLGDQSMAIQTLKEAPVYNTSPNLEEDTATAIERVNCALLMYKIHSNNQLAASSTSSGGRGGAAAAHLVAASLGLGSASGGGGENSNSNGAGVNGGKCDLDAAAANLKQAREFQSHILTVKLRSESRETMLQQKSVMATILTELGRVYAIAAAAAATTGSGLPVGNKDKGNTNSSGAAALEGRAAAANSIATAREYMEEALKFDDSFEPAMIALARLFLDEDALIASSSGNSNNINNKSSSVGGGGSGKAVAPSAAAQRCEQQCQALLRMNPNCEEAVVILTTLMARSGGGGGGIINPTATATTTTTTAGGGVTASAFPSPNNNTTATSNANIGAAAAGDRSEEARAMFEQLLERNPSNYDALVEYLRLLRNSGDMDAVEAAVEKATSSSSSSSPSNQRADPGLSFARGMAHHYTLANADALRSFNLARLPHDNPWSLPALVMMIQVYLVPTTVEVWADNWAMEEKTDNLKCAEQLLLQLPPGDQRQVLHGFCLVATKRPADIEKAMAVFLTVIKVAQPQSDADRTAALAAAKASAAAREAALKAAIANNEIDEDDLLLAEIENALVPGGRGGDHSTTGSMDPAAAGTLAEALSARHVHIPASLGLATALFLSRQETAARNVLRRILNLNDNGTPTATTATTTGGDDDLLTPAVTARQHQQYPVEVERARLFLAHITIKQQKQKQKDGGTVATTTTTSQQQQLDEAQALLKDVLRLNQSCSSAWDSLGAICERRRDHAAASQCFQRAWRLTKENDPAVGYRLAFNYLQGKDPVRAIDVSRTVLSHHAAYPRIEEDVMDVAFSMLRP